MPDQTQEVCLLHVVSVRSQCFPGGNMFIPNRWVLFYIVATVAGKHKKSHGELSHGGQRLPSPGRLPWWPACHSNACARAGTESWERRPTSCVSPWKWDKTTGSAPLSLHFKVWLVQRVQPAVSTEELHQLLGCWAKMSFEKYDGGMSSSSQWSECFSYTLHGEAYCWIKTLVFLIQQKTFKLHSILRSTKMTLKTITCLYSLTIFFFQAQQGWIKC